MVQTRLIEPHALLELLASISDGPPICVEGVSGVEFQDSAWLSITRKGTAAVLPPGTPHYLMSIGKRHSQVVRERKMDQCDFCWPQIQLQPGTDKSHPKHCGKKAEQITERARSRLRVDEVERVTFPAVKKHRSSS